MHQTSHTELPLHWEGIALQVFPGHGEKSSRQKLRDRDSQRNLQASSGACASEQSGHQGSGQRCFHHLPLPDHQDFCCFLEASEVDKQVLAPRSPPSGDPSWYGWLPLCAGANEPLEICKYSCRATVRSKASFAHGSFGLGTFKVRSSNQCK